ncbi:MAG: response regulator [Halobacteriovoraceae bacterium]|nr:response regulator [Halobacteriovoraceae bacterium]
MINLIAVDDESDVKILFDHFFRNEIENGQIGLNFVQSGEDCLGLLKGEDYDYAKTLVLTDINMPNMSGVQLAEKINESYPLVKVFLISAYDARSQIDNVKHLNIAEYVPKPVNFAELKEKIFQLFPGS